MLKDTKAALGTNLKPDITHVRTPLLNYCARACEYGNIRYARSNYARPTGDGPHDQPTKADVERLRAYLRAMISHAVLTLDSIEMHQSQDPDLVDVEGIKRAALAPDTEEPAASSPVGASHLPHLSHAAASLNMALQQAVLCGLLPKDPGATWKMREPKEVPPTCDWQHATEKVAHATMVKNLNQPHVHTPKQWPDNTWSCSDCNAAVKSPLSATTKVGDGVAEIAIGDPDLAPKTPVEVPAGLDGTKAVAAYRLRQLRAGIENASKREFMHPDVPGWIYDSETGKVTAWTGAA